MPSIIDPEPVQESYLEDVFLPDALFGALAIVAIIPLALLLGGFSFIEPWFIVTPPVTFVFGALCGRSAGNVWLKAISMNLVILIFIARGTISSPSLLGALGFSLLAAIDAVLPTVGGIALRRYRLRKSKAEEQ